MAATRTNRRSEEHTSELQSLAYLVCRLLLENDTAAPDIYTLSLHDALPIFSDGRNRHRRHLDDEVDPVAQRSGEPPAVVRDLRRRAAARPAVVSAESARARIHGGHEDESQIGRAHV